MMSRGSWPSRARISSPGSKPARAAGDPGVTATTRGSDIARPGYLLAGSAGWAPDRPAIRLGRSGWADPTGLGVVPTMARVDVDRVLLASPRGFCAGVEMA